MIEKESGMACTTELAEYAMVWADRGYPVMPIMFGKKTPLVIPGVCEHGVKSASRDPQIIECMFATGRENMAISCEGLIVVDVDTRKGATPPNWLLDATPMVIRTPSGGWHFYFRRDEGLTVKNGNDVLGDGIDIKTDGGYVLTPFSVVTYEDGTVGQYRFTPDIDSFRSKWDLPPPPRKLIEALNRAEPTQLYRKRQDGSADGPIDRRSPHSWKVSALINVAKRMNLTVIDYGDGKLQMSCPCHNDTKPSLSVKVTPEGMVLAHCFAGCEFEKIRAVFGLPREFWTGREEVKSTIKIIIC
jgi:hypothetical protein